jgi:hypothetical protein
MRHHFAFFRSLYKAESDFECFVAVYGYLFRELMILIGPGTKFSIKKCTAVSIPAKIICVRMYATQTDARVSSCGYRDVQEFFGNSENLRSESRYCEVSL